MDYLPKALAHSVKQLDASRRQPIKFAPNTSSSASSTDTVRVRFPAGIVDLSTFTLQARVAFQGQVDGVKIAHHQPLYKYFKAVRFYARGQLVSGGSSQHYNILKNLLLKCQTSADVYASKALNGMYEDINPQVVDANSTATAGRSMIEDNWLGLPSNGGVYFNQDIWGDLECEIVLADASVIKAGVVGGGTTRDGLNYSLSGIKFAVDRITPPALYLSMIVNKMRSGTPLRMAFQNYITTAPVLNGSNRFAISTGCLDSLLFAPTGNPRGAGQSDDYENGVFVHSGGASAAAIEGYTWQVLVGENSVPNNPESGLMAYDYTSNCFNRDMLGSHNQLALSGARGSNTCNIDNYATQNHIIAIDTTFEGKSGYVDGVLSGVDTHSTPTDIQFNTEGYARNASWLMVALCSSVLSYEDKNGEGVVSVKM